MTVSSIAILHYSAPPVVGGVEAVMQAHVRVMVDAGYEVGVIAGRGEADRLPPSVRLSIVPEVDSQNAEILSLSHVLEQGEVPAGFEDMVERLVGRLQPLLEPYDCLIVHNVFSKHFNLPLTAALCRLLEHDELPYTIAWCHDLTWTSPSSGSKVHPGYPWDLLRTRIDGVTYVAVSERQQTSLSRLFDCSPDDISVVYNGVMTEDTLGISQPGMRLARRLQLLESDLVMLMPVRVTQAKNIEYALRVTAALKARELVPRLVVTGPPDPHDAESMEYFHSLLALRRQLGVEDEARFVFESGPTADEPFYVDEQVVGDLYRLSDLVLMPSHREGFGMPVLEAGLAGIPVVATCIPAAKEIGGDQVTIIEDTREPEDTADRIVELVARNPISRLRRRVRQRYTWRQVFRRDILPLIDPD